ncbi:MAG: hypothetical protein Q4D19_05955 [Lautropia sp.]|nr:hypothetical protein [Lautropia sp.]
MPAMKLAVALTSLSLLLSGCTSSPWKVSSKPTLQPVQHVCIQRNDKVSVSDFIPVLQERLADHGIKSHLLTPDDPLPCQTTLTYTAVQYQEIKKSLIYARIHLQQNGQEVSTGEYKYNGGWEDRWKSTTYKVNPIIDRMLASVRQG